MSAGQSRTQSFRKADVQRSGNAPGLRRNQSIWLFSTEFAEDIHKMFCKNSLGVSIDNSGTSLPMSAVWFRTWKRELT